MILHSHCNCNSTPLFLCYSHEDLQEELSRTVEELDKLKGLQRKERRITEEDDTRVLDVIGSTEVAPSDIPTQDLQDLAVRQADEAWCLELVHGSPKSEEMLQDPLECFLAYNTKLERSNGANLSRSDVASIDKGEV